VHADPANNQPTNRAIAGMWLYNAPTVCSAMQQENKDMGECRDLYRIMARHVAKAPPGRLSQSSREG
jgi:hypothetical protein